MIRLAILLGAVSLLLPVSARAAGEYRKGACKADSEKLCPGARPGADVQACMNKHAAELSAGCQAQIGAKKAQVKANEEKAKARAETPEYQAKMKAQQQAVKAQEQMVAQNFEKTCAADAKTHCADVKGGDAALMTCLRAHREKLSVPCRQAMRGEGAQLKKKP